METISNGRASGIKAPPDNDPDGGGENKRRKSEKISGGFWRIWAFRVCDVVWQCFLSLGKHRHSCLACRPTNQTNQRLLSDLFITIALLIVLWASYKFFFIKLNKRHWTETILIIIILAALCSLYLACKSSIKKSHNPENGRSLLRNLPNSIQTRNQKTSEDGRRRKKERRSSNHLPVKLHPRTNPKRNHHHSDETGSCHTKIPTIRFRTTNRTTNPNQIPRRNHFYFCVRRGAMRRLSTA